MIGVGGLLSSDRRARVTLFIQVRITNTSLFSSSPPSFLLPTDLIYISANNRDSGVNVTRETFCFTPTRDGGWVLCN